MEMKSLRCFRCFRECLIWLKMFGFDPYLNWKLGNGHACLHTWNCEIYIEFCSILVIWQQSCSFLMFGQLTLWNSQNNLLGFNTWAYSVCEIHKVICWVLLFGQLVLWISQLHLLGVFNGSGRSISITWAIELLIHGPFSTLILIFEDQSLGWKTRQSF